MQKPPSALLLCVALLGGGCSSPGTTAQLDASMQSSVDLGAPSYIPSGYTLSTWLSSEPARSFGAAGAGIEPGRSYAVVLETDVGRIVLELDDATAPLAVNSMVWLARHHFYDGLAFHRVIDDFVAQTGDPNTLDGDRSLWGIGDPGYSFATEADATHRFDGPGVLGMARGDDPASNGSQFFVTFAAAPHLDGAYTVFGKVTEGQAVLAKIPRGEPPTVPGRILAAYAVERMK